MRNSSTIMPCVSSTSTSTTSTSTSNSTALPTSTTSVSPIDNILSGMITNFPSPRNSNLPINVGTTAESRSPIIFFPDMLASVTLDDSQLCTNCTSGVVFSKCLDCCELLCDSCVQMQQCGRFSKEHKIVRYPPNPISPPQANNGSRASSSRSGILEESQFCTNCTLGSAVFSKCMDCCELLCDSCIQIQQCGHLPKEHKIVRYPPNPISPPQASNGSRASSSGVSSSPSTVINTFCDHHREEHRFFCQTCLSPLCTDCLISEHSGHQFSYIEEAIDNAKRVNTKLLYETHTVIISINQAIDNVKRMMDSIEAKYTKTASEVTKSVRRHIAALKEREMELLKRIDQTRQIKGKLLRSQSENLRLALTKLTQISEMLNECGDSTNGLDVLSVNELSAKQLKQVNSLKSDLIPCEDDGIMFLQPDNGFFRAISSFGNLNISPILSNKMLRLAPGLQNILGLGTVPANMFHRVKNQTIHGVNSVIAKDGRHNPPCVFGGQGHTEGLLFRPWGVCCDHLGNIIVADRGNNRIQIFNAQGVFLRAFGKEGYGPGEFRKPAGVAVAPTGHLVVGDKDNHRIQVLEMNGTSVLVFGERGSENGQFYYPWDVACNSLGHIVVSDTRNHRIQIFNSEGIFINKYGFEGTTMWKHFDAPRGVSFTPKGNIIVTDFNNHRIVVIDEGLRNAQFLGEEGGYSKQFLRPQGVVCDDSGNIIVADSRNNRIQVFESSGTFLWKFGRTGLGPGEMDRPSGICLNPQGRIVVIDFGNHRVQIF